jgi:hypothetical protein
MIKKYALLSLILAVFLMGSDSEFLVRFTVINQSEVDIGIRLTNTEKDINYYLSIPEGDKEYPTEKEFTLVPAIYEMQVFYKEVYDPVYGYPLCKALVTPARLYALHNIQLTFDKCFLMPSGRGEPTMMKFWLWKPWKSKYIIIR